MHPEPSADVLEFEMCEVAASVGGDTQRGFEDEVGSSPDCPLAGAGWQDDLEFEMSEIAASVTSDSSADSGFDSADDDSSVDWGQYTGTNLGWLMEPAAEATALQLSAGVATPSVGEAEAADLTTQLVPPPMLKVKQEDSRKRARTGDESGDRYYGVASAVATKAATAAPGWTSRWKSQGQGGSGADIDAQVKIRFNEWMTMQRSANVFLDTVPEERQQEARARIRQEVLAAAAEGRGVRREAGARARPGGRGGGERSDRKYWRISPQLPIWKALEVLTDTNANVAGGRRMVIQFEDVHGILYKEVPGKNQQRRKPGSDVWTVKGGKRGGKETVLGPVTVRRNYGNITRSNGGPNPNEIIRFQEFFLTNTPKPHTKLFHVLCPDSKLQAQDDVLDTRVVRGMAEFQRRKLPIDIATTHIIESHHQKPSVVAGQGFTTGLHAVPLIDLSLIAHILRSP